MKDNSSESEHKNKLIDQFQKKSSSTRKLNITKYLTVRAIKYSA